MTKKCNNNKQYGIDAGKVKLGAFIQNHRKKKGYTQQDVADMLGITLKSVSYFECGRTYPSLETLFKLSEILEMSLDEYIFNQKRFVGISDFEENNDIFNDLSSEDRDMVLEVMESLCASIKKRNRR